MDLSQQVRGQTNIMIALNEREIIDEEVVVMDSIGAGIEMLIGDPSLRTMTQRFNKALHIRYENEKSTAFIGNVQLGPAIDTIVESDCIIQCIEIEPKRYQWYFQWVWKTDPPSDHKVSSIIYYKNFDRELIKSNVREWANSALEPCPDPLFGIAINPVAQEKEGHPIRITGDFKPFNAWIQTSNTEEANEVCSEAIVAARRHRKGTVIDLRKAYQSVHLHPQLRAYNAFLIDNTWFQATQMLFGIAIGQKVLFKILQRILPAQCVVYRDDIFIPDGTCVEMVEQVLHRHGFQIKKEKTYTLDSMTPGLFAEERKFLGLQLHLLEGEVFWSRPKFLPVEVQNCSDLASALGGAAASHLPCIGAIRAEISILRSLLGKYVQNDWSKMLPESLIKLWVLIHGTLKNDIVYRWFVPQYKKYILYTDASGILLGGCIRGVENGQESEDILDFCKRTTQFHVNLRELDAVILGLQELEKIADDGVSVQLVIDSKSCESWTTIAKNNWIVRTKAQNKTLIKNRVDIIRETLRIKRWCLDIQWVPSKQNPADKMTRVRPPFQQALRAQETEEQSPEQSEEKTLAPTPVFTVTNTVSWHAQVQRLHLQHYHPGKEILKRYIRVLGWPVETAVIDDIYARCELCLRKRPAVPYVNLKQVTPIPVRNWEWIQMDTLTVKTETKVLIAIDERTRFIEVQIIHGAPTAKDTITLLTMLFHRYQLTEWHIRMDRGKEFYNSQVATWVTEHGGTCHYSTVRRPTACGMVERVNRSLLNIMRIVRSMFPENTLKQVIDKSVQEYWARPHKGLHGMSPRQALYECQPISETDLDDTSSIVISDTSDSEDDDDDGGPLPITPAEREQLREDTFQSLQEEPAPFWTEGQKVLIHEPTDDKLHLNWTRGTVVQNAGLNQAVKVKPDATEHGRQRAVTTVNQRWIASIPDPMETAHGVEQRETTHAQEREVTHAAGTAESPRRSSRRNKPSKYLQEPYL